MKEEIKENKLEIAKKLIDENIPLNKIQKVTGLTKEEILNTH